mmetsp:Transcript_36925/g.116143  ORF Transcript_36925/g.116143 Transcript_36925/m.116143 type:complete len:262 (-) Transcript_36925:31-816(-)
MPASPASATASRPPALCPIPAGLSHTLEALVFTTRAAWGQGTIALGRAATGPQALALNPKPVQETLQAGNIDGSGSGDLGGFTGALDAIGLARGDLHHLHVGTTTDLPFDWARQRRFEPFRMVSVDAGHTAPLTFNDLEVAACSLARGGIVILDDFFHPHWAGVTEGMFQFLAEGRVKLHPFLECHGKLFMTDDPQAHGEYYGRLWADQRLSPFLKANSAHVGGSKFHLLGGMPYMRCEQDHTDATSNAAVHELWASLLSS